jgi:hypothetical protein
MYICPQFLPINFFLPFLKNALWVYLLIISLAYKTTCMKVFYRLWAQALSPATPKQPSENGGSVWIIPAVHHLSSTVNRRTISAANGGWIKNERPCPCRRSSIGNMVRRKIFTINRTNEDVVSAAANHHAKNSDCSVPVLETQDLVTGGDDMKAYLMKL